MTAKTRFAARVGAAAFVAGVSLAVPQTIAIAAADRAGAGSRSDTSSDSAARSPSSTGGQPNRAGRPGPRAGHVATSGPAAHAAAAQRSPGTARAAGSGPSPRVAGGRRQPDSVPAPVEPPAAAPVISEPPPVVADVLPTRGFPAPAAAAAAPVTAVPVGTVAAVTTAVAASPPAGVAAVTTPSRPGALAAVTASAGASASSAELIDRLLAPIRAIFGEGTALLVRRTFFNQAPTTAPVQLTGQSEGPITGMIGAVDPEGDPLSYTITSAPLRGSAVVNADGTYVYTPGGNFTGTDSFVVAVADNAPGFHINLLDLARPANTSANVAVARGAVAAMLRFQFIYGSGANYWSSAARSALESAATTLASSIVVDSPVTVTYAVTGALSPFSSTLASAGSDFVNDGSGFLQTVVQSKILSGYDANGADADGSIDWNFGPSWAFGSTVPNNQYDFQSIAMHELLHTLGFLSNIDRAGSNTGKVWTVFDSYVVNSAGTGVINSGTYTWNTAYNSNLTGGNNGLYFNGPNAMAAYQALVPLYTPSPWESGSSLSHLNDRVFTGSNEKLMNAITSTGPAIRVISPVELGILSDIGYTVTSGPGTPVLLFFGLVTLRVRRRRD